MELLLTTILSSLAAYAIGFMRVMPEPYYRYLDFKPFNCATCLAFWLVLMGTFLHPVIPTAVAATALIPLVNRILTK